jgi:hypothetical protein
MYRFVLRNLVCWEILQQFLIRLRTDQVYSFNFGISFSFELQLLNDDDPVIDKFHHLDSVTKHFKSKLINNEDEIECVAHNPN